MKKLFLVVLTIMSFSIGKVTAQENETSTDSREYKNAAGIKVYPGALTIKHFFNSTIAVEGISYFYGGQNVRFTGLFEFHFDINTVPGLRWYVGPGAHVSFAKYKAQANTFIGIDGVLGLDYKFEGVPINLSLDWQPSFEFGKEPVYIGDEGYHIKDGPGFTGSWAGIGVRYTF